LPRILNACRGKHGKITRGKKKGGLVKDRDLFGGKATHEGRRGEGTTRFFLYSGRERGRDIYFPILLLRRGETRISEREERKKEFTALHPSTSSRKKKRGGGETSTPSKKKEGEPQ